MSPAARAKRWTVAEPAIQARKLSSGYWHIRGTGPCEWSQPPEWPCSEDMLREHAFPQASEAFIRAALAAQREARP